MGIVTYCNGYSSGSHKKVEVTCDFQASCKCKKKWSVEYRLAHRTMNNNGGKIICLFCSRSIKNSGRNNPNCIYSMIDDNMFESVLSEEKAYLLGWIASDGTITDNWISIERSREPLPSW